jgi:hypothetical protein
LLVENIHGRQTVAWNHHALVEHETIMKGVGVGVEIRYGGDGI